MASLDSLDFATLHSYLPGRLKSLLEEAEAESWPFVPENWQYGDLREPVNTRDLLDSLNVHLSTRERDVLLACLKQAVKQGLYTKATSVAFLLDRYMYFTGRGQYLQDMLGLIQQKADVRIAPQMLIRKARLWKDEGSVQAADELLKFLIDNLHKMWNFRTKSQLDVCLATCVQIRGQIHHNLGLSIPAATFVIESLDRYRSLKPEPDRKGISSSLGILAEILSNFSPADFTQLALDVTFRNAQHPLLEAAAASYQAAFMGRFDRLFVVRNHRRAAEVLLAYLSQLDENDPRRGQVYQQAFYAIVLSLQSFGQNISALGSKEQAYEYISTMFQLFLTHSMAGNHYLAECSRQASSLLYTYYCSPNSIKLSDDDLKSLNENLRKLGVPEFQVKTVVEVSMIQEYDYIFPTLKKENTHGKNMQENIVEGFRHYIGEVELPRMPRQTSSISSSSSSFESHYSSIPDCDEELLGTVDPKAETRMRTEYGYNQIPDSKENGRGIPIVDREVAPQIGDSIHDNLLQASIHQELSEIRLSDHDLPILEQSTSNQHKSLASDESDIDAEKVTDLNGCLSNDDERIGTAPEVQETTEPEAGEDDNHMEMLPRQELPMATLGVTETAVRFVYQKLMKSEIENIPEESEPVTTIEPFKAYRARVFKYDVIADSWSFHDTMVFPESLLCVPKGKEGNHREVIKLKFLSQEEPRAQYLGKRYKRVVGRRERKVDHYFDDVRVQMISRYYVAIFNDRLKQVQCRTDHIQIVPAMHIQVMSDDGSKILDFMNVEPFIRGNFVKLTNNFDDINTSLPTDGATAFTHFTYQESGGKLMVVDLQGWVPSSSRKGSKSRNNDQNNESSNQQSAENASADGEDSTDDVAESSDEALDRRTIVLTDPAINSQTSKPLSFVDMRAEGFAAFWSKQHPTCNHVCRALGLVRP